jgi:hypothetical protein
MVRLQRTIDITAAFLSAAVSFENAKHLQIERVA